MVDLRLLKLNLLLRYSKLIGSLLLFALLIYLWLTVRHLYDEIDRLEVENERLSSLNKRQQNEKIVVDKLQISSSRDEPEIVRGKSYPTEMDMPRFSMFTSEWVYLVEPGLGKRVVERLYGSKKDDYLQVVAAGNQKLKPSGEIMGPVSFMFGIVRLLPRDGMHYELVYKEKRSQTDTLIRKVIFLRPFGQLVLVRNSSDSIFGQQSNNNLVISQSSIFANSFKIYSVPIHFVMTATSDHMPKVLNFLENHFAMLGRNPGLPGLNINLTLVMFLDDALKIDQVRELIKSKLDQLNFQLTVNLVPMVGSQAKNFSRGLGLHSGIVDIVKRQLVGGGTMTDQDPLIFTTDVDVVVTPLFLNRCRLHAERGRRVYFPLVYSLYNPKIVYPLFLNRSIPTNIRERLNIHDETGWWRDFGYGMGCFYKSDYDSVGGFGSKLHLRGWGYEDVGLFRKFVQSKLLAVRAVDPGIFHIYHKKQCDAGDIGNARYRSCIASRAYNEASHSQLGVLCFKNGTELV